MDPLSGGTMTKMFLLGVLLAGQISFAGTQPFQLPSRDGKAQISGQIDIPECGKQKYPTVLIVGGTGLFTRNGYFGRSGTARDFLFTDLAQRLNAQCLAAVRFDYRGVRCDLQTQADSANCVDRVLRATVTDQTILDDIQVVYDWTFAHAAVDSQKVVLFGHSEGSLNISRLVQRKSAAPRAILFMGGVTESPRTLLHWQIVDRSVEWMFAMDQDRDGWLTNDEIRQGYKQSPFNGSVPLDNLLSPTGGWLRPALLQAVEANYLGLKNLSLTHADTDPYLIDKYVYATYQWWKRWLTDDVSVVENLKDFTGPIVYHNGDVDAMTPGGRELAFLQDQQMQMRSKPRFVVHPGKGHGLSPDPHLGPIDADIADQMVQDIVGFVSVGGRN